MPSVAERLGALLTSIKQGNAALSAWMPVPDDHVLDLAQKPKPEPFVQNEHYFVLRVHQAYLAAARQWFTTYDPMLFALTEFTYDGGRAREPFLVSPDTFYRSAGHGVPAGMSFNDVRATGLRPYRGNTVNVTLVLYRNKVSDMARRLLGIAERCLAVPQLSAAAGPYVAIAETGLDVLESILGLDDTVPLLGTWQCFDPLDSFRPGWFVLCESAELRPEDVWVRGNRLWQGPDPGRLTKVERTDFVLCSLGQARTLSDAEQLPVVREMWQPVRRYAAMGNTDSLHVAKALMAAFTYAVTQSADLLLREANELVAKYTMAMKGLHDQAMATSMLGPGKQAADPLLHRLVETLAG
jgi:hypothetical protein